MCSNSIKRCARDATKRIKPCVAIIFSDLMLIGLVGSPNKGKSTLFSALTMAEAEIAIYVSTAACIYDKHKDIRGAEII